MTDWQSNAEAEFRRKLSRAYTTSSEETYVLEELEVEITLEDVADMERETDQLRKRMAEAMA